VIQFVAALTIVDRGVYFGPVNKVTQ